MNVGRALIVCLLLVMVGLGSGVDAGLAQDATPDAEVAFEGVAFEPLAFGAVPELPPSPAMFQLVRLRLEPEGRISIPADDPGLVLLYVESGALTGSVTTPVSVMRGAMMSTPAAQPFEDVAADTEFTLGPGDSFVGQPMSGGQLRNDGSAEVVLLVAGIQPEPAASTEQEEQ